MSENTTTSENGSREFLPPSMPTQKQPICRLSILAAILFVLVPIIYVAAILIPLSVSKGNYDVSEILTNVFLVILGCLLVLSLAISIVALVRIALSDRRLGGDVLTGITLAGGSGILFFASMPAAFMIHMKPFICATNLEGLVTALKVYVEDHDDQLPPADQWCDVLIVDYDVSPKSFICPASDALEGESCYAMNKYVAGKKLSELPSSMVLLFETHHGAEGERNTPYNERGFVKQMPNMAAKHNVYRDRWNQVGGPGIFFTRHSGGANILFSDRHSSFESFNVLNETTWSVLEKLCWDENKTQYKIVDYTVLRQFLDKQKPSFPKSVFILGFAVAAAGLAVCIYTRVWRYGLFCIGIAVGAAVFGFVFGGWGEGIYRPEYFRGAGIIGGAILGVLLAPCYIGLLMKYHKRLTQEKSIKHLAVAFGLVTGMLCSTLLHLALMLIHKEHLGPAMMTAALPFGLIGGAILGALSGWIVLRYYRNDTIGSVDAVS